jgi:hypothetical protein
VGASPFVRLPGHSSEKQLLGQAQMQFLEVQSSIENYWRALILFGRNVAQHWWIV